MKKIVVAPLLAVVGLIALNSCMKNNVESCKPLGIEADRQIIDEYILNQGISYVEYESSILSYFGVSSMGTGSMPAADSLISYKYAISLMDGTSLGTSDTIKTNYVTGAPLRLTDFDPAGIDYYIFSRLRKGGTAKIIVPSTYRAGGCQQVTLSDGKVVPANSQLIYDYTLTNVAFNN